MTSHRSIPTIRSITCASALLACAVLGQAQTDTPPPAPTPPGQSSFRTLNAIKNEIHELYTRSSASLVRVDIQQSSAGILSPALREEFDRWVKNMGEGRGNRGGDGRERGDNRPGGRGARPEGMMGGRPDGGRPEGMGGSPGFGPRGGGGGGGPGGFNWILVRNFLNEQADKAEKSGKKEEAATFRGLAINVSLYRNGFQGDLSAVLLSRDGYALIPAGLLRLAHDGNSTINATLPDGAKTTAKFVGTNLISGYTIVQFDKTNGIKPTAMANGSISPGDLLLFITAGQGQSGLLVAPGKPGAVAVERLAVPADERSGTFLFDVAGDLAAFVSGGNWNGGRQAFSSERLKREINFIIKHRKDIEQRPLGIAYKPVPADLAARWTAELAGRRAVVVTDIAQGTLAANSTLKSDDVLLSIDGRPVSDFIAPDGRMPLPELIHLQADLATRTGQMPLGILREGKEVTIAIPLD